MRAAIHRIAMHKLIVLCTSFKAAKRKTIIISIAFCSAIHEKGRIDHLRP